MAGAWRDVAGVLHAVRQSHGCSSWADGLFKPQSLTREAPSGWNSGNPTSIPSQWRGLQEHWLGAGCDPQQMGTRGEVAPLSYSILLYESTTAADPWPPSASPQRTSAGPGCHQPAPAIISRSQPPLCPLLCACSSVSHRVPRPHTMPAPLPPSASVKASALACHEQSWELPAAPQRVGTITAPRKRDG